MTRSQDHPGGAVTEQYDYIIVGAGSAGCVLAARPDRGPQAFRVLLLEAGRADKSWQIDMPSAVGSLLSSDPLQLELHL